MSRRTVKTVWKGRSGWRMFRLKQAQDAVLHQSDEQRAEHFAKMDTLVKVPSPATRNRKKRGLYVRRMQ